MSYAANGLLKYMSLFYYVFGILLLVIFHLFFDDVCAICFVPAGGAGPTPGRARGRDAGTGSGGGVADFPRGVQRVPTVSKSLWQRPSPQKC